MNPNHNLKAYVDGELPLKEMAEIHSELALNPEMSREVSQIKELSSTLGAAKPIPIDALSSQREETLVRLKARQKPRSSRISGWPYLAGLGLAASLCGVFLLARPWKMNVRSPWQLASLHRSSGFAPAEAPRSGITFSAEKLGQADGAVASDRSIPSPLPDVTIRVKDTEKAMNQLRIRVQKAKGTILGTVTQKDPDHPGSADVIFEIPSNLVPSKLWTGLGVPDTDLPKAAGTKASYMGRTTWQIRFISLLKNKPSR